MTAAPTILFFALLLLGAVVVSEYASRSVLSTAVIFLIGGFCAGPSLLGIVALSPYDASLRHFIEITLFGVLFTDGLRLQPRELAQAWRLPGRALLFGMPLVFLGTACVARVMLGTDWPTALLVGAVLAPTDPVFASSIVGRDDIPHRLRHLLHVESGLNDGLALPAVIVLINAAGGRDEQPAEPLALAIEVLAGIAIGIAVPWLALQVKRRLPIRAHAKVYQPLLALSIALIVWSAAQLVHANAFLAAFTAGVTVTAVDEHAGAAFRGFGEVGGELMKLAVLLLFGALIDVHTWQDLGALEWLFALVAILAVRPIAVLGALFASPLTWRERAAAAWFGPKGFASALYALLLLQARVDQALHLFHVLALVITVSIIAHASSDVPVARWVRDHS